jgi:hypothetical protein
MKLLVETRVLSTCTLLQASLSRVDYILHMIWYESLSDNTNGSHVGFLVRAACQGSAQRVSKFYAGCLFSTEIIRW